MDSRYRDFAEGVLKDLCMIVIYNHQALAKGESLDLMLNQIAAATTAADRLREWEELEGDLENVSESIRNLADSIGVSIDG